MRRVFSWLFNRTVLAVIGLLITAILVFYVGPMISIGGWFPLESVVARGALIALIVATWLGIRAWGWWRDRQANAALLNQLTKDDRPEATSAGAAGADEVAELRKRFEAAVATLKKSRVEGGKQGLFSQFSRAYVYQMPWYVFIGAPGSGKTTALVNSGLEFPLADKFGKAAIRGIGGTRNCDWWFTNQAVLIDTAGRYTTQESNLALDKAEWEGFLELLRKYRPRAPINGVLLTASVADLLGCSESERDHQATTIRRRLAEIYETLKVRFPVYVVVTKTDLLAGFDEYFDRLTANDRAQVWGFTFPLDEDPKQRLDTAQLFKTEYALLQKRIEDALPDLLQAEPDLTRRALAYGFTQQFAGLHDVLERFLATLFAESKFAELPMLRGVYFTSGTQEGTPFDRVLGSIQRRFGVEAQVRSAAAAKGTGKSFFLKGLLQNLVFAEAHLVSRNPARDRRRRKMQIAGVATLAVLVIGAAIGWTVSFSNNRAYLGEIAPKVQALARQVQATPNTTSDDVTAILAILNDARDLASSSQFDVDHPPLGYRFGLYQGPKVQAATDVAYNQLLDDLLLPRIALRLARLLEEAPRDDLESTYLRLKAYLMLHEPDHYQPSFLVAAVTADWRSTLSANLTKESQQQLAGHLRRLLDDRVRQSPFPRNDTLVKAARDRLGRYTQAQRIYGQLKATVADKMGTGDFTLVNAVGPEAKLVFARTSGAPLDEGVAPLFTREGYRSFQDRINDRRLLLQLDETWVVGKPERSATSKAADFLDERLLTELRMQFLDEYRLTWEKYLADLRLRPATSLADSIQLVRYLSAPDSPLLKFIRAVAVETTLTETGKSSAGLADRVTDAVKEGVANQIQRGFGGNVSVRPEAANEQTRSGRIEKLRVDDYFEPWRRIVAPPGQGGSDQLTPLLREVYTEMTAIEAAQRSGNIPPPSDTANKLRAEAARLPIPLRGMLESIANTSATQISGAVRSNVGAELEGPGGVGDFCRKAIAGRYPLSRSAAKDVDREDFGTLFALGGKMDDFFQKRLAPLVDVSTRPWSFRRGVDGTTSGTSGSLIAFQQAAVIRDTFFRAGGRTPQFRVELKFVHADASITGVALDVDGQVFSINPTGPQVPKTLTWPGQSGTNQVSLRLEPQVAGGSSLNFGGQWALHRLFDKARVTDTSPERFNAEFTINGRTVTFEVYGGVYNPLKLPELERFNCPGRL